MSSRRRSPRAGTKMSWAGGALSLENPVTKKVAAVAVLTAAVLTLGWATSWGQPGVDVADSKPPVNASSTTDPTDTPLIEDVGGPTTESEPTGDEATDEAADEATVAAASRPSTAARSSHDVDAATARSTDRPTAAAKATPRSTSRPASPARKTTSANFSKTASDIQKYGYSRSTIYAGLVADAGGNRITVYRKPSADFDAAVRAMAGDVTVSLRTAQHSRTELQSLQRSVLAYAESKNVLVSSTEPPADGGALVVRVAGDVANGRRILTAKYGSDIKVLEGELGAI
jgi:hypothetical protein